MKTIPFLKESQNGHDTQQISGGLLLQEEVEKELQADKWVTLENKKGETEILTKSDIPPERLEKKEEEEEELKEEEKPEEGKPKVKSEEKKPDWQKQFNAKQPQSTKAGMTKTEKDWAKKFEPETVSSATSVNKAKGG